MPFPTFLSGLEVPRDSAKQPLQVLAEGDGVKAAARPGPLESLQHTHARPTLSWDPETEL